MSTLSIKPQEAAKNILNKLPGRRMRHVVEKRFGLKGGRKQTLESIGREYRITRERVRQIESEALKHLRKENNLVEAGETLEVLKNHFQEQGGVVSEERLFSALASVKTAPHVSFILTVAPGFECLAETDDYNERWVLGKDNVEVAEKVVAGVVAKLHGGGRPVTQGELHQIAAEVAKETLGREVPLNILESYLAISKKIQKNPYGEYGLSNWSFINPRGIRDKAYTVLVKSTKPLHFREVAEQITRAGWGKKKAHPQTVHNELIKDNRFVLVGRGVYGLKEWGYEPGLVRDVLVSVIKNSGRALGKEEVIQLVSAKRLVKPQTVLLNLQNKSLFKKTEDGKYTLV